MKVGASHLDITPQPGIDLAGFAVRPQPSTRVLDPLGVRVLYVEDGPERLLWLHADLLAFGQAWADQLRARLAGELGLPVSAVVVAATHTHSGPATISLTGCGRVEPAYLTWLEERFRAAARLAVRNVEPCQFVHVEGHCALGVDRRRFASAHTDPRVAALGWRRDDGSYKAVLLNYAMHPVCLRGSEISADWPGEAGRALARMLPGEPVVLVGSGACANINPPAVGVTSDLTRRWGTEVAQSVLTDLLAAPWSAKGDRGVDLKVRAATVELPLEDWDGETIQRYAAGCLADPAGSREFGDTFRRAVETWRGAMLERWARGEPARTQAELSMVAFGQVALVTVNAEIFSKFGQLVSAGLSHPIYAMGSVNGMLGYVPSAEAYDEGAYEVTWAMFFYNLQRPRKGGLELLARRACDLVAA